MNAGLSNLQMKNPTLTLLGDLTVSAQEDVFYCGLKDETHILQKALFDNKFLLGFWLHYFRCIHFLYNSSMH